MMEGGILILDREEEEEAAQKNPELEEFGNLAASLLGQ